MNNITIAILILIISLICLVQNKYIIYEDFSSDEAVQNISSLYNQAKLTVTDFVSTGNATVNGILTTNALYSRGNSGGGTHFPYTDNNNYITSNNNILRGGPTTIQGNLQVDNAATISGDLNVGATIKSAGRMHIAPGELLYLLPTSGVVVGKEWGGTGNLSIQGDTTLNGKTTFRALRNVYSPGDLGEISNASSIEDCSAKCQQSKPSSIGATYLKTQSRCWCKNTIQTGNPDNQWDTAFFI